MGAHNNSARGKKRKSGSDLTSLNIGADEHQCANSQRHNGTSPRHDIIVNEILKAGGKPMAELLDSRFRAAFKHEWVSTVPNDQHVPSTQRIRSVRGTISHDRCFEERC